MGIRTDLLAYHEQSKTKFAFPYNHGYPKSCYFPHFNLLKTDIVIWQADEEWHTWYSRTKQIGGSFTIYENPPLLEFLYENQEDCVMFYCDTSNWSEHGLMKKIATVGFTDEGLLTQFMLLKDF